MGQVVTEGDPESNQISDRRWTTGFYKKPVDAHVTVETLGIVGDAVADTRHHGGPDKAILCYAAEHYQNWVAEHPELPMSGGALGENLTIAGVTETDICIGDRFAVGSCQVQVSQPRQPCWKISRRWGVKTLTKEVTQTGRTGWYVRVLQTGELSPGDELRLLDRPHPDWPVARANDVMFGRENDRMAVFQLMNLPELAPAWKADIA
ncbi:MAG: MOSC domain-containing protein [Pirellulaceae bacterium]|nr:MOSC domain-containing protein [Pirellulaceae bacterium]